MQRLITSYALYSRYKHKKPGHRLEGRYKAKLVQGDDYILALTRYIHLNPVKVKSMASRGAAERQRYLEQYAWSRCHGYLDARRQETLVCYDILDGLGEVSGGRCAYRKYLYGGLVADDEDLGEAQERSRYGIGDQAYVEELEQELMHRKVGEDRDRDVDYPVDRICMRCVDAVVAKAFGTKVEALRLNGHAAGAGLAKAVAMELAGRLTGLSQRAVGALHGGISSQAMSLARRKARTEVPAEELARLAAVIRSSS